MQKVHLKDLSHDFTRCKACIQGNQSNAYRSGQSSLFDGLNLSKTGDDLGRAGGGGGVISRFWWWAGVVVPMLKFSDWRTLEFSVWYSFFQ